MVLGSVGRDSSKKKMGCYNFWPGEFSPIRKDVACKKRNICNIDLGIPNK